MLRLFASILCLLLIVFAHTQAINPSTSIGEDLSFQEKRINELAEKVELYPNPFYNNINIRYCNGCQIKVYNWIGKLEIQKTINSDLHKVETSILPEGIYLFDLIFNDALISSGKLLKN